MNDNPATGSQNDAADEGFLSRWSRRKKEVALETVEETVVLDDSLLDPNDDAILDASLNDEDLPALSVEEVRQAQLDALNELTDDDMPDVKTLDESSDYAGFMSKNVSDALRKMALRKLFAGESYNVRDGLDEYDGDYTSFEKLDPSTVTADMKHMLEVEARRLKEKLAQDAAEKEQLAQDTLELAEENDDSKIAEDDTNNDENSESVLNELADDDALITENISDTNVKAENTELPNQDVPNKPSKVHKKEST